jgi:hypothetical protein
MDRSRTLMVAVLLVAAILAAGIVAALYQGRAAGAGPVPWIIIAIAGGAFIFIGLFVIVAFSRRGRSGGKSSAEQTALELGLTYQKKGERGFHQSFGPLPGVPRGGSVQHVFSGRLDVRLLNVFQHMYMIHTGQAAIPIQHTIYVTEAPHWPGVTIAPRKGWTRLMDALLRRERLLLEDEAFNAAYTVKAEDEDFALTLLHEDMQRFMTGHRALTWQVNPGWVAMIYTGPLKFDRMEQSLARLREFWALVPEELEAW